MSNDLRGRTLAPSPWIVPMVLVIIAGVQVITARIGTLTPWKGGGFGMFASIDRPENRYLFVNGTTADGDDYRIVVRFGEFTHPQPLTSEFENRALSFPRAAHLRQLAEAVLRSHLVPSTADPRVIPTRLTQSIYQPLLGIHAGTTRTLEVLGPLRRPSSFHGIKVVHASVLAPRFDLRSHRVALQPIATASAQQIN